MFAATVPRLLLTQIRFALLCLFFLMAAAAEREQRQRGSGSALNNQKSYQFINHACSHLTFRFSLLSPHLARTSPRLIRFVSFRLLLRLVCCCCWLGYRIDSRNSPQLSRCALSLSFSRSLSHAHPRRSITKHAW